MEIALWGASGTLGSRILMEALNRGHAVRAAVRDSQRLTHSDSRLDVIIADAMNPTEVAAAVAGTDALVSALGPSRGAPAEDLIRLNESLLAGVKATEVRRLVVVGGAGSLYVFPGQRLLDTPDFPAAWRPVAEAAATVLARFRQESELDWTIVSPPAWIAPGERTGRYRTNGDFLVVDADGKSHISAEDFAVAVMDEVEHPRFVRQRFTVGY
ncbi:MAG: NAD(P)-dependent oxidoreductase [Firmicutes bacterium]|nr:NAD(P)-dependent oxidoreductase [Bacillota bacterium]